MKKIVLDSEQPQELFKWDLDTKEWFSDINVLGTDANFNRLFIEHQKLLIAFNELCEKLGVEFTGKRKYEL